MAPRARRASPPASPSPALASSAAYDQLRELIVRGELLPGTRITELDVADRLAISRTPAREALRRLWREGLLVATGAGLGGKLRLAVAPMTVEDVRELYELAGALEGTAARNVDTLGRAERRALADRLRAAEEGFRAETKRRPPDYDRLFHAHDAFHRVLVEALAGATTRELIETLRPRLDRYEWMYAPLIGPNHGPTFTEHAAIIRAVRAGDAAAAEEAVQENWRNGAARLSRTVETAGEIGFLRRLRGAPGPEGSTTRRRARS